MDAPPLATLRLTVDPIRLSLIFNEHHLAMTAFLDWGRTTIASIGQNG